MNGEAVNKYSGSMMEDFMQQIKRIPDPPKPFSRFDKMIMTALIMLFVSIIAFVFAETKQSKQIEELILMQKRRNARIDSMMQRSSQRWEVFRKDQDTIKKMTQFHAEGKAGRAGTEAKQSKDVGRVTAHSK